ncbi:MAG: L,D-transpeptidase family protein [Alteraurantiacibacter sp.]
MSRKYLALIAALPLMACGLDGAENGDTDTEVAETDTSNDFGYETYGDDNYADTMASNDEAYTSIQREGVDSTDMEGADTPDTIPDSEERPIMQAQVVLDRQGWGPGVIDGKMGMSTENALRGFQEANDLEITGEMDKATEEALSEWSRIPATRVVTIPASWGDLEFFDIPDDAEAKSEMERLGYKSLDEKLAERFHTTVEVLKELNPNGRPAGATDRAMRGSATQSASASSTPTPSSSATRNSTPTPTASRPASNGQTESVFRAGQQIRVPNIGADRISPDSIEDRGWQQTLASLGVGSDQPEVDRIVVSKAGKTLKAYNGDELVALFTVSSGSSQFPLPLGEWDIVGEAFNPPYSYDPEVLGQGDGEAYQLPPGPNGPVGVVWIDLSKEHYGIHGTPDPETIGRAQSSGCVRLTNWDAARLAGMVNTDTQVIFEA